MLGSVTGAWAQTREVNVPISPTETSYPWGLMVYPTMGSSGNNKFIQYDIIFYGASYFKYIIIDTRDLTSYDYENCLDLGDCHLEKDSSVKIVPDNTHLMTIILNNTTNLVDVLNNYGKLFSAVFEIPHVHSYPDTWSPHNDTQHKKVCITTDDSSPTSCGSTIYEKHTYATTRESGAAYYTCSICGYVNEKRKHEHVVATEWSYDGDQHWHACLGSEGACDAGKKLDVANHTYGTTGTAYYTCTTCGYVDTTRKNAYELPIYKEEKIAALQALVDGIESTLIATKAEEGKTSINQATSKANVDTAYNNAASALQALIAVYNDGKNAFTQPTSPGMRLKVTKKDGTIYEFQITDVESTEYYRATE